MQLYIMIYCEKYIIGKPVERRRRKTKGASSYINMKSQPAASITRPDHDRALADCSGVCFFHFGDCPAGYLQWGAEIL